MSQSTKAGGDDNLAAALALAEHIRPALARRDRPALNDIIRQLTEIRAPLGAQWEQIAYLAANNGELGLAQNAAELLGTALGATPAARYRQASVLAVLGAWREAEGLLQAVPKDVPDPVTNTYSRGIAALNLGDRDEARRCLEQVVRQRPQTGPAWLALAMSVDFASEPELAERLEAAEASTGNGSAAEQVPFYYALGKALADRGEHARAFDAFGRGARQMKPMAGYKREDDRADAARSVDGYTPERIAAIARQQHEATRRTIFVTGLPRSGTTLVEQILTSHSTVSDGAETGRLSLLADEIGGQAYPALAGYVEAGGAPSVAPLWHHWMDELFPGSERVVDKTVTTSRFLGLAAALLPEAPLIWMTRDPLDRAWSCFRTNFNGSAMPWSYDLQDIAYHFRLEDQLLAQWQEMLGERLLVVPYESLVADPEPWTRRILGHCGLAEEPQAFAPHENRRAVSTASMMQVRRPINREAVGSAEPYREFLRPFIEAYYG